MRPVLFILSLFFALPGLFAQDSPEDKKAQLSQLLSEAQQLSAQGDYAQAVNVGEKAVDVATQLYDFTYLATALHVYGKSLYALGGKSKLKAVANLEKSLQLARGKKMNDLQRDNLEILAIIARERGKDRDLKEYTDQLAALGGNPAPPAPKSPTIAADNKSSLKEENAKLYEQVAVLSSELSSSHQNKSQAQASIERERRKLVDIISTQQEAIQDMNEKQAKDALLLLQQKKVVDSLHYLGYLDSLMLDGNRMALRQKETQLKLANSRRNLGLVLAGGILIITLGIYNRFLNIKRNNVILEEKNRIILEERQRSENLLLNILPSSIAEELKTLGHANTRRYDSVSVLFADFKNFTTIAEKLTPEELVSELDLCFRGFDKIIGKYGLEKIKTIGDAYMCAGGLPDPYQSNPSKVIQAAFEMQNFLEVLKEQRMREGRLYFEARIGIHTGPIIAGVVGETKFAYDIWGDTVNVAARMESSSDAGRVNISSSTYQLVKDQFKCEYRGKISVKNKGEVEMYWVEN
jgi:class 3 adenylate cyclase